MSAHGKPTAGPLVYQEKSDAYTHIVRDADGGFVCQFGQDRSGKAEGFARLLAEAGTVQHETGKTPRQLADEVERLRAELDTEIEQNAPLPPDYRIVEFIPGVWHWEAKGEHEWAGDGTSQGFYEAAVVAAWQDYANTIDDALQDSCAAEIEAATERDALRAEVERLRAIVNTPQADDFLRAVSTEAEHQRQRWGSEHDAGKTPADWFWLIGYLAGKALHAHAAGNTEKAEHHVITTAAACENWHRAMFGHTDMRPGIDGEAALAEQQQAGGARG